LRSEPDPERTMAVAGQAFLEHLLDRIGPDDVTRLLARLRRGGRKPKTVRNIFSTLYSALDLAVRRRHRNR
jgi:hypothetical protein